MNKQIRSSRIFISWFLLATFCLHLTGCYSKGMIPLEQLKARKIRTQVGDTIQILEDWAFVLKSGGKMGILKSPRWTETGLEGQLHNPFQLVNDTNLEKILGTSWKKGTESSLMPTGSKQMDLFLIENSNVADALFEQNDSASSVRNFSLQWKSIDHISYEELNSLSTGLVITFIVLPLVIGPVVLACCVGPPMAPQRSSF